jgi:hypothetical protein
MEQYSPTIGMGAGLESRRCAEHGFSFLPGLWQLLFSSVRIGPDGELLDWDLDLVFGGDFGSRKIQ